MTIRPYFLEDKSWYEIDEEGQVHLTELAPEEARKSFEEYQKNIYPQLSKETEWFSEPDYNGEKDYILKDAFGL